MKSGLGTPFMKGEGKPIHPDDTACEWTEEGYRRQLKAYNEAYGIEDDND